MMLALQLSFAVSTFSQSLGRGRDDPISLFISGDILVIADHVIPFSATPSRARMSCVGILGPVGAKDGCPIISPDQLRPVSLTNVL